tara:strand:- start:537 stop:998 length:462 start_codon:yes stop_codon:yes gene_type:complete
MSENTDNTSNWSEETQYSGRVKWFNNKAGFGFVTIVDGDKAGEDVFAHHSGVNVTGELYKYLVQGEYVHFHLRVSDNNDHPYQAGEVTGLYGGKLMCETRHETKQKSMASEGAGAGGKKDYNNGQRRYRGGGPRDSRRGGNWSMKRGEESENQ